jgi:nucleoside-diphosphate-sugar epimerase
MRALVTGGRGFLGARLVQQLLGRDLEVRTLVRRGLEVPWATTDGPEPVRGDVTDADSVARAVRGCDLVFHCAWGGDAFDEARRINVGGTRHVVEAAARAGVRRVVHVSTMSVHGKRLPQVLTEECPFDLEGDAYGVSKAEGEQAAFGRGRDLGVEVVALRPTLIYGPRAPLWVLQYFDRVRREQVALIDGGSGLANLVYVDDVVDAMWAAAERPGVAGEAFLVNGDPPVTWREYLGSFARMCDKPLPPSVPLWRAKLEMQVMRIYGTLAQRPRRFTGMDLELMPLRTTVSIAKAQRLLGWRPAYSLEAGMAECEAWLRREGYLPRMAAA